jgi:hypothetical protein
MEEGTQLDLFDLSYSFELLAEFTQFYLQDELSKGEAEWNLNEGRDGLALAPGLIAVGTTCERVVPVEVRILLSDPPPTTDQWDHLVECTIDVQSGRLVVYGCCEDFETAHRINLQPGKYRARVCYGNQYSYTDDKFCSDYYVVMLWRSNEELFQVVKRRVDEFYELIG